MRFFTLFSLLWHISSASEKQALFQDQKPPPGYDPYTMDNSYGLKIMPPVPIDYVGHWRADKETKKMIFDSDDGASQGVMDGSEAEHGMKVNEQLALTLSEEQGPPKKLDQSGMDNEEVLTNEEDGKWDLPPPGNTTDTEDADLPKEEPEEAAFKKTEGDSLDGAERYFKSHWGDPSMHGLSAWEPDPVRAGAEFFGPFNVLYQEKIIRLQDWNFCVSSEPDKPIRFGRGNLAVGPDNSFVEAHDSILVGTHNVARGSYGAVLGGKDNVVQGIASTVIGGSKNSASGTGSVVGAGYRNEVTGLHATAIGGYANLVEANMGVNIGGENNEARGDLAASLGGIANEVTGKASVAVGGDGGRVAGLMSTLLGGRGGATNYPMEMNWGKIPERDMSAVMPPEPIEDEEKAAADGEGDGVEAEAETSATTKDSPKEETKTTEETQPEPKKEEPTVSEG